MSLFLFLVLALTHMSHALKPCSANTSDLYEFAASWVPGPKIRGTWSILYSCLFTLLLCVYTAIHLNVPAKEDSKPTYWLRWTKWILIAIFAPEIIVYTAIEQWVSGSSFLKKLRKLADVNEDLDFKV